MVIRISDLRDEYPLVYERVLNSTSDTLDIDYINTQHVSSLFIWDRTEEGPNFWSAINVGDFETAKQICPHLFKEKKKEQEFMGIKIKTNGLWI